MGTLIKLPWPIEHIEDSIGYIRVLDYNTVAVDHAEDEKLSPVRVIEGGKLVIAGIRLYRVDGSWAEWTWNKDGSFNGLLQQGPPGPLEVILEEGSRCADCYADLGDPEEALIHSLDGEDRHAVMLGWRSREWGQA